MRRISVIDTRALNLRCFTVEQQGKDFVVSNVETFLENCNEKTWKKNLGSALTQLANHPLEKEIVFILPETNCLNLIVSTQEDPQLTETQRIEKALHKEFGLYTDRASFKYLKLNHCRYAVSLISHHFWYFFKTLIEKTLNLKDKKIYYFPPFIGHWAYFHKKFDEIESPQIMLFVEKNLRRFIAKTEDGIHFLDFKTSGKEPTNLWNELFGTQKFIQHSLNIPSGIKHCTIIGEKYLKNHAPYVETTENCSYKVEESIPEIFGTETYLNLSEQSLLVGLLTNLIHKDKFTTFDFSTVQLPYRYHWKFLRTLQKFGTLFLLLYALSLSGIVIKQTKELNRLEKNYKELCCMQKQIFSLKAENKQYEKQAYAQKYLASTFIYYLQLFYELPFQICIDSMQVFHQREQNFLEIQGHVLTSYIQNLQDNLKEKLEKKLGTQYAQKILFEKTKVSDNFSFFKIEIPLNKFPSLLSSFL